MITVIGCREWCLCGVLIGTHPVWVLLGESEMRMVGRRTRKWRQRTRQHRRKAAPRRTIVNNRTGELAQWKCGHVLEDLHRSFGVLWWSCDVWCGVPTGSDTSDFHIYRTLSFSARVFDVVSCWARGLWIFTNLVVQRLPTHIRVGSDLLHLNIIYYLHQLMEKYNQLKKKHKEIR